MEWAWFTYYQWLQLLVDLFILVGILVGIWQLLEWRKVRRLEAMTAVNERLQAAEVRRARRTVYNLPEDATPESAAHWPDEAKWDAELVCSNFELVGLLAAEGVIPGDWVARNWRFAILNTWERTLPLIEHYRQTRSHDYWHYFEKLVQRARKLAPTAPEG